MTIDRTRILDSVIPFDIVSIFKGGSLSDVQQRLTAAVSDYDSILTDYSLEMTFDIDEITNEVYLKIWRLETDREYNRRKTSIESLEKARATRMANLRNQTNK